MTQEVVVDATKEEGKPWSLRDLRLRAGKTVEEVAASMGVPVEEVEALEEGGVTYGSELAMLVRALGGTIELTATFPDGLHVVFDVRGIDDTREEDVPDTVPTRDEGP